jgi:hypothetical protein
MVAARSVLLVAVAWLVRHPSRRSIGAVFGLRSEGNGGARSAPVDRVDNSLEHLKASRRQTDTSADHNTVIVSGSQVTLHRLPSGFIRSDVAHIAFPPSVCHLLGRKRDTGLHLLGAHSGRISRIGVVTDQQDSRHRAFPDVLRFQLFYPTLARKGTASFATSAAMRELANPAGLEIFRRSPVFRPLALVSIFISHLVHVDASRARLLDHVGCASAAWKRDHRFRVVLVDHFLVALRPSPAAELVPVRELRH